MYNLKMKIKRVYRYVCLAMFALLSVPYVHGAPIKQEDHTKDVPKLASKIKFGIGVGLGTSVMIPYDAEKQQKDISKVDSSIGRKICFPLEGYGEYLFDSIGLRLSLKYASKGGNGKYQSEGDYVVKEGIIALNYFMIAPTLRWYPGKAKQFCIFIGPLLGHLSSAKCKLKQDGKKSLNIDLLKVRRSQNVKLRRWDWGLTIGWDYELTNGFVWGAIFNWDLSLREIFKYKESYKGEKHNFLNVYSQLLYVGYNFAKLL
jgi:hypothetical protein